MGKDFMEERLAEFLDVYVNLCVIFVDEDNRSMGDDGDDFVEIEDGVDVVDGYAMEWRCRVDGVDDYVAAVDFNAGFEGHGLEEERYVEFVGRFGPFTIFFIYRVDYFFLYHLCLGILYSD